MPSTKLDEYRKKMNTLRASQKRELEAIRDNNSFVGRGRTRQIAKVHLDHRRQAAALREKFSTNDEHRRLELHQRLFGIPSGTTGADYRDAAARVADLRGADELRKVLDAARQSGDIVLERAAAAQAHQRGHHELVDSYADRTGQSLALDELRDIPSAGENALGVTALFSVGTPEELKSMTSVSDSSLEMLVNETDTADVY